MNDYLEKLYEAIQDVVNIPFKSWQEKKKMVEDFMEDRVEWEEFISWFNE